ncbi:NAD-dependent epimerase/dehydratase family protein, partial [bacterium]|nr:NAD-dependent epimerase/dehydratase family protein [bacterium]
MDILVIGGTGLISTSITHQLVGRGHDVTLYNRGRSETRFPDKVKRITGDRGDFAAFERQMRATKPFDCVIDMVCFRPDEAESLIRAFHGRAGQLIFCSTVDVYARPTRLFPITEDEPRGGVSEYGRNKVRCEEILLAAHRSGAFPVTVIRPAMTYGEGGVLIHSFGWSTTFLDRIRKGRPVIVHGDGQSLWTACHIDDVARAFVGAVGNARAHGKCYHATGEEWMT